MVAEIQVVSGLCTRSLSPEHSKGESHAHSGFYRKRKGACHGCAGARHLLIDLTHSPFVSKAGLRALHQLFNTLRAIHPDANLNDEEVKEGIRRGTYKSPDLKLLNVPLETKGLLEGTGFDMYVETFTDMNKAIASF